MFAQMLVDLRQRLAAGVEIGRFIEGDARLLNRIVTLFRRIWRRGRRLRAAAEKDVGEQDNEEGNSAENVIFHVASRDRYIGSGWRELVVHAVVLVVSISTDLR